MGSHRAAPRSHPQPPPEARVTARTAAEAATKTPVGGRRRETRVDRARRSRFSHLPGLPTVIGGAVVVAAVTATVTVGQSSAIAANDRPVYTGNDAANFVPYNRGNGVSRDSQRQALQQAASQALQRQAEAASVVRTGELTALAKQTEKRAQQIALNIWHLPTQNYTLTARFGQASGLWAALHTGLDFATATGTPIFALANGVITQTGPAGPYGNLTIETLTDGSGTEIYYAHQSEIGVKVGQTVVGGQMIGRVGATGNTTGPHVHIEVRPGGGDPVDPYPAFIAHGVRP